MYQFLSPHGDKFQQESVAYDAIQTSFRPLAGINFNMITAEASFGIWQSFRPLAGINFNYYEKVC